MARLGSFTRNYVFWLGKFHWNKLRAMAMPLCWRPKAKILVVGKRFSLNCCWLRLRFPAAVNDLQTVPQPPGYCSNRTDLSLQHKAGLPLFDGLLWSAACLERWLLGPRWWLLKPKRNNWISMRRVWFIHNRYWLPVRRWQHCVWVAPLKSAPYPSF